MQAVHALVHRLCLAHPQAQLGHEKWGQISCTCCLLEIYASECLVKNKRHLESRESSQNSQACVLLHIQGGI